MSKTYYTNGIKTIRLDLDVDVIPEGFYPGAHWKGRQPWNKGLTKDTDERVKQNVEKSVSTRKENGYVAWNKGLTKDTDSRIKGLPGELNPMYGKHKDAWNKGLTKETDERMKKASNNHKGCVAWNKGISYYQTHTEEDAKQMSLKIQNTKKKNNSYTKTQAEENVYQILVKIFGKENIYRQYIDERYPFHCDFYIKATDLFIEVQGFWAHGIKPYDYKDKYCKDILSIWKQKSKTSKFYEYAIKTWTINDVKKRNVAKQNNLNFIEIFNLQNEDTLRKLRELLETPFKKGQSAAKQIIII